MSEELKPCPFCGGKAALRTSWMADGYRYRVVECVECGATTPGNYSEVGDQSAWDWNTRTPDQAIAATLGETRKPPCNGGFCPMCSATLGGGECELEIKDNMNESEGTGAVWWECSSCHWQIEFFHSRWLVHAKFCPECGARIRKAVKR